MIVREMPHAKCDVLRFQLGEMETRNQVWPDLGPSNQVLSLHTTQHKCMAFHLYGWGKTLERAEAVAKERYAKYGPMGVTPRPIAPIVPVENLIPPGLTNTGDRFSSSGLLGEGYEAD